MAPNVTCVLLLFLLLRKKKKTVSYLIYIFPFSASLFLEQGRWKQSHISHLLGTQHQNSLAKNQSELWLPCPFCPKCVMHDPEDILSRPPSPPSQSIPTQNPLQSPKAGKIKL